MPARLSPLAQDQDRSRQGWTASGEPCDAVRRLALVIVSWRGQHGQERFRCEARTPRGSGGRRFCDGHQRDGACGGASGSRAVASSPSTPNPQGEVVDRPLLDIREYPVGFHRADIGPGTGRVSVISRSSVDIRVGRLTVPVKVALAFRLIGVRVGTSWQRASMGIDLREEVVHMLPWRGEPAYAPNAINVRMPLDLAWARQDIEMLVENITSETQTFMACLCGDAGKALKGPRT